MKTLASLSVYLLLLSNISASDTGEVHFIVLVTNSVMPVSPQMYITHVLEGGILLGGLTRLQDSNKGFTFTYTQDPNYGPFLQSVNGLPGDVKNKTYWELLVKDSSGTRPLNVGIGCFIPKPKDEVILKYTTYGTHDHGDL
ncbi:cobalamin binding intrinsic factor-like [Nelusetta ayraudi]|uniref:cobalamin binding intrinsic factor-like n=1 Tax=Nelusetta ayraudi TaxID=303726 RepID=UPI003F6FBB28